MSQQLTFERLKELGEQYGIHVEQASDKRAGGFYKRNPDGTERKMEVHDFMEFLLPGSTKQLEDMNKEEEAKEIIHVMQKYSSVHILKPVGPGVEVPIEVEVKTEDISFKDGFLFIGENAYAIRINGDQRNTPKAFVPIWKEDGLPRILCDWKSHLEPSQETDWMLDDITLYPLKRELSLEEEVFNAIVHTIANLSLGACGEKVIKRDTSFELELNLDTADAVELTFGLEDTFDVEIPNDVEEIISEKTVQDLIDYVVPIVEKRRKANQ